MGLLQESRGNTFKIVVEQFGIAIGPLETENASCRRRRRCKGTAYAKTNGTFQAKQVVVGHFYRATRSFILLVTDAGCDQNRLGILDLNQKVSDSRLRLVQR